MSSSDQGVHKSSGEIAGTETVSLTIAEAHELGGRALAALGFSARDARTVTDQLVDNQLCGYPFAGLSRILAIEGDAKSGAERRPVRITSETDNSALIDGGNNVGYVAVSYCVDVAIEKARKNRFAVVGVYDSYYSGRNAYYLERVARADLVGIHVASAKPRVAPLGGKAPALGTNPIAFGFPSRRGPIVFDMGTASIMWGDVLMKARIGEPLPDGIGLDSDGKPTTDAAAAALGAVLPFGGHKGYGLSFAVQALGLLAGAAIPRGKAQDYGFLFIVFDPGLTVPVEDYKRQMSELVDGIKNTPRAHGVDEIMIPSERAFRERDKRLKEGRITIDRILRDRLVELAGGA